MKTISLKLLAILPLFIVGVSFGQNVNMSNGSSTQCGGTFYDSGGNGGTYAASASLTYTFCPSTAGNCLTPSEWVSVVVSCAIEERANVNPRNNKMTFFILV